MKYSALFLLCLLSLQSIAFEEIRAEEIEGSGDADEVLVPAEPEAEPELLPPDEGTPLAGEETVVKEPDSIEDEIILDSAAGLEGEVDEIPVDVEYVPVVVPVVEEEAEKKEEEEEVLVVVYPEVVGFNDGEFDPAGVEEEVEVPVDEAVESNPEEKDLPPPEEQLSIPVDEPLVPNIMRVDPAGENVDGLVYTTPEDPTAEPREAEPELLGVEGAPSFSADCPAEKIVASDSAVTVRCKVTSDTDLSNLYFFWHQYIVIHLKNDEITDDHEFKVIENNSSKIMLLPSEKEEPIHSGSANTSTWGREGGYFGLIFPQDDGSAILELKINHMMAQMYRRHFFVAENDIGSTQYVVELKRDPNEVVDNSSATSVTTSSLVSCLAIFAVTALLH